MLRLLPPTYEPVLQQIRLQGFFFFVVVKRATSDHYSTCFGVAKQVARFLLPVLPHPLKPVLCRARHNCPRINGPIE